MIKRKVVPLSLLACAVYCLFRAAAPAAAQEPFYKGKSIRIMVGFTPGGFYDRWARLYTRYMPKYIPGNPEMIVQNMPGAGSLVAANHVFNVAKPDGLTLVMTHYNFYLDQLVGRKEVQFDARKFGWIGSPASETIVMYMRADTPYKTVHDLVKAKEPVKCGSSGTASGDYILSKLLEEAIGAKIDTVLGYPGGSEIDLAVEKGEVVCRAHNISAHFGREPFDTWHKKNFDRHIVQTGKKRDPRMTDVPTMTELFEQYKTPDATRRLAQVLLAGGDFGRPMMVTPGTPPERIKILRAAYDKAMKDPDLLREAEKGKMDVDPTSGEELEALVKKTMDQPKEVLARVQKMLEN
jgi:tripartite-type tricarboxylate transporter receptor subunit TctC